MRVDHIYRFQVNTVPTMKISMPGYLGEHDRQGHQWSHRMEGSGFLRHYLENSHRMDSNVVYFSMYKK